MARGHPALLSAVVGLPFVLIGLYLYLVQGAVPGGLGIPFALFGTFVVTVGLYIQFVAAPDPPVLAEEEQEIDRRHPTQRVAFLKLLLSIPPILGTLYLLFGTTVPYVYPTVLLFVGLFFLSSGIRTYWANSLTTYYVTNKRVISHYRLLSLSRREVRIDKVRGVDERQSPTQSIAGLGAVHVASGSGGGALVIAIRDINNSTDFADEIRTRM